MNGTVKLPFYARLALTLLAVVLIFEILSEASGIFIPLAFGLLISILLYPLARFFEVKLRMSRLYASMLSILLFISALTGFIYFLTLQIMGFANDMPQLKKRFEQMFDSLQHWLSYKLHINNRQQTDYINKSINGVMGSVANSITNVLHSTIGILLMMIFIFIFTFFMLYHRRLLQRFALHLFSVQHRPKVS